MSNWRDTSEKIILLLFSASILLFASSFINHPDYSGKTLSETFNLPIGQSVYAGDSIVGVDNNSITVPLLSNWNFLTNHIANLDLYGLLVSISTGTVPFDFSYVATEHIDSYGVAYGFDGPGYLTYDGSKLTVKAPDTYIWGYSTPSKWLEKTDDGVKVIVNGTVSEIVPVDEIKNQKWGNDFYNIKSIQNWYNSANNGSTFVLEKGISNFSDGRSDVLAGDVEKIFGKNISDYVAAYPVGTPIVLYMGKVTEESGEVYSTTLGSRPHYGDELREYNARQFVDAWNNTIIPPHSAGNGKAYIDFGSASDDNAPGGSASHGVCPPARALRAAVLGEGFSLPVGMVYDSDAVLYGYNPSEDIKITNDYDVPIKIVMWTEGSGTSMGLYAKIVKLVPDKT